MIEDGFYWVKTDSDDDWQPAQLEDGKWWVIGCQNPWKREHLFDVGAKINRTQ